MIQIKAKSMNKIALSRLIRFLNNKAKKLCRQQNSHKINKLKSKILNNRLQESA